ncbi:MAG: hypothetical protein U0232_27465 [Thermomicrobiales bacterium]
MSDDAAALARVVALPAAVAAPPVPIVGRPSVALPEPLTRREVEVLRIAERQSDEEIAGTPSQSAHRPCLGIWQVEESRGDWRAAVLNLA